MTSGMAPEDIDAVISDGVLTVQAERTEQDVDKNHSEIRYGVMSRRVTLPPRAGPPSPVHRPHLTRSLPGD
ncbi:Hsp20/alpha crystallin family protein [Streptomyces sp. NPDC048404]|uniref:Hsp20/alpha crystallin family protein n=1 Tax=unclassified Streptomyces TaxID=2593676 RepID=UPI00343ACCF2